MLIACDRTHDESPSLPLLWGQAFYAVTHAGNDWRIVEVRLPA